MVSRNVSNMERTARIWQEMHNKLYNFILKQVGDKELAEDILHEAFVKIHGGIDALRDETKIHSWVFHLTHNLITDHFREAGKKKLDLHQDEVISDPAAEDILSEALTDMVKMMDELPVEYCEALCLTELGEMNQKQYAEHAGLSYSGAKSRIQRARIMLKDMMMKCCHYEFDKYGLVIDIRPYNCCCCDSSSRSSVISH